MSEAPSLTKRELSAIGIGVAESFSRVKELAESKHKFDSDADYERRFTPGPESFGSHEAGDRAFMLMETWNEYVASHPSVLLDHEAHRLAKLAAAFMAEVYQVVMTREGPKKIPDGNYLFRRTGDWWCAAVVKDGGVLSKRFSGAWTPAKVGGEWYGPLANDDPWFVKAKGYSGDTLYEHFEPTEKVTNLNHP